MAGWKPLLGTCSRTDPVGARLDDLHAVGATASGQHGVHVGVLRAVEEGAVRVRELHLSHQRALPVVPLLQGVVGAPRPGQDVAALQHRHRNTWFNCTRQSVCTKPPPHPPHTHVHLPHTTKIKKIKKKTLSLSLSLSLSL